MKYFILSIIGLALISCVGENTEDDGKTTIVCTTSIAGDLVKSVVPDDFEVISIMGPGIDPHIYKPKPGDIDALQKADYVVYNGLHLEGKMGEILENFAKLKPVFALSEAINERKLIKAESFQAGVDPHIWFDPSLWQQCGEHISDVFSAEFPDRQQEFKAKKMSFKGSFKTLLNDLDSMISAIPEDKKVLVTAHDAFSYFARRYKFELITIQGLSTQADFSIKTVEDISNNMVEKAVSCAFFESSIPRKSVETLINVCQQKGLQVKSGGTLYSDALGSSNGPAASYFGMFRHNVKEISSCLSQP